MRKASVRVANRLGLHARAAAQLVRAAAKFESHITVTEPLQNVTVDAKSILSVLTLSASTGTHLVINVEGEDEKRAIEAIISVFETGFGEL